MTGMDGGPPTVTCPGCGTDVEVEHVTVVDHFNEPRRYVATETDHHALLGHVDVCTNLEHGTPS